jgi:hypothetical protein
LFVRFCLAGYDLVSTHADVCHEILQFEESMVESHRASIDTAMKVVKEEMELLKKFDSMDYNVDQYVDRLDHLLDVKISGLNELRQKLNEFRRHLREEETLSSSFNKQDMAHAMAERNRTEGHERHDRNERNDRDKITAPHLHPIKRTEQYR